MTGFVAYNNGVTHITIGYYKTNQKQVAVGNMFVNGNKVERLTETPIGDIDEGDEVLLKDLRKLTKIKKMKIELEEVDSSEVDYSDDADFLYAMGGHGCDSFDEFIDRMNFPED